MPSGTRPAPPDDTVRLALSGLQNSYVWAIVLWLRVTATTRSATDLSAILTTINNAVGTNMLAHFTSDITSTQLQGVWKAPGEEEIVSTVTTTKTGALAAGTVENLATSVLVNWHVNKYYRGGKPRSYLPCPPAAYITDHVHLGATPVTNYTTDMNAFMNAVNAATSGGITKVELGTVSFQDNNEWRATPEFWPYQSASIRSIIGIQRRRLLT